MPPEPPIATYRFQLTPQFGFDDVVAQLEHVRRLGISHVYLSPIAEAVTGSSHGYDVVDHTRVRAELGGAERFEALLDELAATGLSAIVDHVPNHMAATQPDRNPMWWSLLRDGPGSAADRWFDVDWERGDGRVILPVLGAPLDDAIADGHIRLVEDVVEVYGARRLPLRDDADVGGSIGEVLERQHYRLQFWREPARNVRRFFTIDDLVGVRVEDADVAAVVDTLPARYADRPGFGGVRIDHVDGLADPAGYLAGLRERVGDDALIWVEKIVAPGESLPAAWPVDGTTGYEFIRACDHALLAEESQPVFDRLWHAAAGDERAFHEWETEARLEVIDGALAPEAERLIDLAAPTGASASDIEAELRLLTTGLDRYRTYLPDDPAAAGLIREISDGPVAAALLAGGELTRRWQQLTGPVMAKGAEDRSFYRYLRLASLCEVGGAPGRFGMSVSDFHADNERRAAAWPRSLLAASTHDTKRSDDVRSRSAALTWRAALAPDRVRAWWTAAADQLVAASGVDAVTVGLALQTTLAAPDVTGERLTAYLVKAEREAALRTSWEDPDAGFEDALAQLAEAAVEASGDDPLELDHLAAGLSLTATTLRLSSPGVPDVYQGTEAFTHRLVDPDNRVPPDWDALAAASADERTVADAWAEVAPEVKTILTRTMLDLRRRRSSAFDERSSYDRLDLGTGAIGYRRGDDVVVVVRRGAADVVGELVFPPGAWFDVLDPMAPTLSGSVDAASAVGSGEDGTLPVAVFERE